VWPAAAADPGCWRRPPRDRVRWRGRRRCRPSRCGAGSPPARPSRRRCRPAVRQRRAAELLAERGHRAHQVRAAVDRKIKRAQHGDGVVGGAAQLGERRPGRGQAHQFQRCRFQIALGLLQYTGDPIGGVHWRIIGDEVAHQLGGEMAVRRGVPGEPGQRLDAALLTGGEAAAHQRLRAGLVAVGAEQEAGRIGVQVDRPTRQDVREPGHVGLGVAGRGADGVQFQALARQVLVQAAMLALAGAAVGADRLGVVEVEQHRGVAHHRQQHVAEAAGGVRADRLAHEGADHGRAFAAAQADGEVVGPEPHQPLAKRRGGGQHGVERGRGVGAEDIADRGRRARAGRAGVAPPRANRRQPLGGAVAGGGEAGVGTVELRRQPGGRVGRHRLRPRRPRPKRIRACAARVSIRT
jgi:hypothetical protein